MYGLRHRDAIYGIHRFKGSRKPGIAGNGLSYFMVEGDSFLLFVRTVGNMLPLSEVKRPLETFNQ